MTGGTRQGAAEQRAAPQEDWTQLPGSGVPASSIPGVGPDPRRHGLPPVGRRRPEAEPRPRLRPPVQDRDGARAGDRRSAARSSGIEPGDIRVVVMTHLHLDHASAISEFTEATYVLGQGEWEAFHAPLPTFHGYVRKHVEHAVEYREVVYDRPVDRLLFDLRALLRPLRRRLGPARLHAWPQRAATSR